MAKALNVSLQVSADTGQAKQALQSLQQQLTQLTTTPANITIGGDIKQGALEASKAIAQLQTALKSSTNSLTGNLNLTKFNQEMTQSGMSLQKYKTQLEMMGPAGQKAFAQLASSIAQAEVPLRRSGGLLAEFWTTLKNTARWQISSSILHGFMGAIQGAYSYAQDLNKSLNDIQIVTQASDDHMAQFAKSANTAAKQLSTTTTAYTKASLIYYQQGLSDKEVTERTNATIKMANVTGQSAQQVSDQMTAIWNNFADGSTNLEYYADVITALGAATASSSEEISRGLEKFASIADTVGLSYENATAALATITATTRQSADTVGTGLRTLFSRLQSVSLGETLEDGVNLTKYSQALEKVGVQVLDTNGELRSMDDILEDLGARWNQISDSQKTALAQTVGGVRQYTTLMALMDNFDFYKQNQQVAANSEGTLQKQQAIYEKSWEAASKRVRASAESIYSDLLDDQFFIKLTDGFSKFLDQIHNSIQAIGGLKGVLLAIGTVITTVFADKAATKLQNFINNIKSITPSGRASVQELRAQGATMLQQSTMGQGFIGDHMSMAYAEQGQLQAAYLANAERMSAEQQSIAQALMQQQAALVENVQLEAQAAEQANKKATADTIATKRIINQNVQSKSGQTAMKDQIGLITSEAKTVGKIDSFLGAFDGQKITNINQVAESLKRLKLSVTDFESYAPGAGQAFKQLTVAMKMDDADPRKIEEVQKALDKLNTIRGEGFGGSGLSLMVDNLKNLAQTQLPREQYEEFCNILDRLVSSAQSAGAAEQSLSNTEGQLTGLTKMLSAAMDELAQKQYTLSQSIVNLVGGISSLAMAYNNLKGLKETWSNEDMSFGDKMLSTLTTLGPTLMIAQNGLSKMGPAILKIGSSVGTVIPAIGKAGTAIAGLGAKAGLMSSSVAAGAGAAAASFGIIAVAAVAAGFAIYKIAEAIETPQERLKRLSKEADVAQTAADEAKTAYENLLSLKSQHNELLQQLNTLTEGTHEFRDALIEANKVAREIIAANNFKYGVDYTIQDGKIIFNETSMKRAEEAAIQFEEATETSSLAASILQEGAANAITEANNYKEADRSAIWTTGNYSNLILNPNATQISTILTERNGSATTSNGEWTAQDIASIMGSEGALGQWNKAMEEYFYWLARGNEGSYGDYWDYLKEQSEKEGFWTDAEYQNDRDAWNAVGAMNLEQAQWYFDTYFKELFPEGTTLDDIGHGMLGEHDYVFEDRYTTGIRVANKSLSNALGIMADEANLGVAGDVVVEKLLQKYSDNNELTALESQIEEEIDKNISNGQTLQQQYKDLFGKAADSEMSDSDIRDAIKQQKLWNKLYSEFTTEAQKFANVELGKYENFNKKNYGDLMSLIQEGYNADGEDAEAYRIAADTLVRELSNSYAGLHDALGLSEGQEGLLLKFVTERNLSIDQINDLTKNLNNFNNAFGEQARNSVLHALTDSGYNTELSRILNNIDFSDTLSSLFDLKKAAKKYGIDKGVGKQLNDLYNDSLASIGGEAGLLEELYKSEDFKASLEDLQKVYDQTGKIAASDILSAAKSNKLLNTYLEETNMQASTLAEILTMVGENGSLSIDQISNALISAINAATSLENGLANTFQFIDDFSLSRSAQDIGDFYKGLVDTFEKGIGQGNVGDKQIYEAYAQLFGNQAAAGLRQDFIRYSELAPGERNAAFQADHAAEIAAMQSIKERGDLSGLWGYYQNKGAFADSGVTWDSATYDLAANGDNTNGWSNFQNDQGHQIKTSDDYRAYVADELKKANGGQEVDPQLVESLIQDQLRENAALQDYLLGNDAQAGLQELLSSSLEQGLLNEQELAAFYEQYGQYLKDENGNLLSLQDITRQFNQNGIKILKDSADYLDEKGRGSWEGFRQQVNDSGMTTSEYFDQMGAGRTTLSGEVQLRSGGAGSSESQTVNLDEHTDWNHEFRDLDAYIEAVQKAGYSYQDAMGIAEESGAAFSRTVTNAFGETSTYIQAAGESVEDFNNRVNAGVNTSNIEAEAAIYAEAFKSAFTDVDMTVDASAAQEAFDALPDSIPVTVDANTDAADAQIKGLAQTITVRADAYITEHYVNGHYGGIVSSYARGSKNRKLKPGIALTGEEKPEIVWNPEHGYAYIVGKNGPEFTTLQPGDRVFNGEETAQIFANSATAPKIFGSYESGGYGTEYTFGDGNGGSNASADNVKTSKWEPERYHLITRQLKDLQREYERLSKIKDNAYGTNKLEAIQAEIDATNQLIEGQKALIHEVEDYLTIDADRLKELIGDEFQIDENGNLTNFEELQKKYRKAAEEDKDEKAQDIWKALQQYEETVDKLQEANVAMQDLLYQEMELRLEKITAKVDMRIDFDEREIKLLEHYIKRIDDNIYHTAEVLALTEQRLGHINQKIEDTKEGINGLFAELSDSQGNKIINSDTNKPYTLKEWLALPNEQRDLLDINDKFGKQLEEYMDDLLDYIEELEEFKTKGVEEFGEAFSELNDNVRSSIDLFDHYNQLLSSLKNITDLQGVKLSAEMRAAMKDINTAMFNNTQNNVDAERENYRRLRANVADLQKKVAETADETLKKQWQEQLKTAEEELRTSQQNLLSLWETGLQQAKDMFETALQDAADEYETTIAGMYGTTDELQKAWDQQKKNDDFYVKDFEKYYQIQKLQRSITKDLDAAARAGNRQNKGLKKLYDDLNAARESGVELSSYDLDIFEKRYEYEKALMELEDARNNKSEVRLQRDANGNWGYVYTSSADEDDLIAKQQAVDDKFYERQKATQERIASLSDDMMSEIASVGARLQDFYSSGASEETIAKYLEQESKYIENYRKALAKALEDAGMTEEEARLRYGNEGFDILNQFSETLLSSITGGNESLDEFFARVQTAMEGTNHDMKTATGEYQDSMKAINDWFNESGEDLATVIRGFASIISEESDDNLLDSEKQIQKAKNTFNEILRIATQFEQQFLEIYQPIIDENEKLVADLLYALHALNREEYENQEKKYTSTRSIKDIIDVSLMDDTMPMATGGYTGSWGTEGRIAMLHEKELVLNKNDTKNFLDATNILRTIDLQTNMYSKGLGSIITPWINDMKSQALEQDVHIEAIFPDVKDHNEIELAFDNLINKATQYANRKNMSAMTFQDMYTTKF